MGYDNSLIWLTTIVQYILMFRVILRSTGETSVQGDAFRSVLGIVVGVGWTGVDGGSHPVGGRGRADDGIVTHITELISVIADQCGDIFHYPHILAQVLGGGKGVCLGSIV